MIITAFDPTLDLIVVTATLWGPQGRYRDVQVAVDTGAAMTLIIPEVVDELGYSVRTGGKRTSIRSALGSEPGYVLRVAKFAALGYELPDFRMHVHDLADEYGLEGLVGLRFLHNFDYTVRSSLGQLRVAPTSNVA